MTDRIGSDDMGRVISQDRRLSMPYEYSVIWVQDCTIMAITVDSPFNRLLATYSSEEMALKAMNRMTNALACGDFYKFPTEEQLCAG